MDGWREGWDFGGGQGAGEGLVRGTGGKKNPEVLLNAQIVFSSFPRSFVLKPVTWKPIELSHLEGHLSSLTEP